MPFVGVDLPLGTAAQYFDLGVRAGGVLGYRVLPFLSLNGEVGFELFEPNQVVGESSEYSLSLVASELAISPMFHVALQRGEVVLGPKIGAVRSTSTMESWNDPKRDETKYGLVYGLSLGVFGNARSVGLGVIMSYIGRQGLAPMCADGSSSKKCVPSDFSTLSASIASLF
jgi:hypothetical protein